MARIPYLDLAHVAGPLGERLRERPPLNLFRLLPHAPGVATGFLSMGQAVLRDSSLPPRLRELLILRVGALSGAAYEIHQHRKLARKAGVPDATVEAILSVKGGEAGWRAVGLGDAECAALAFTDATVREVKAGEAAYAALARHFGPAQQIEVLVTVGFYMLVSRLLENLEVDLETVDVENLELRHA
ncbi:carboxymuconolactone decarboxylase family protein [Aquabacterium sp. A7-Y]|uniref:carboxymuconolactone decarboxylase family protein n=1 Tax=Aquabacterium sp. A7-Y TaxID=1349605 RepID=UPI00223E6E53|nr:carboxymuconolactone decarboxylase family protein [Aquabacterium sp. A7-Y]MCW7541626.1 carboxymuconolactone decarboxylase family protein [Aquabacterium sp. A7-Y]